MKDFVCEGHYSGKGDSCSLIYSRTDRKKSMGTELPQEIVYPVFAFLTQGIAMPPKVVLYL